jgi:hypothetical protein
MIKVAGVWEQGWNTPICEYDLWAYPLRDFGVDEWYMTPVSGINRPGLTELKSLEEVTALNPDLVPVYVDEEGEVELQDFEHPEDVLYICGKASYSPWRASGATGKSIRIKTIQDKGLLWPHQCMALILYDRMLKSWQ